MFKNVGLCLVVSLVGLVASAQAEELKLFVDRSAFKLQIYIDGVRHGDPIAVAVGRGSIKHNTSSWMTPKGDFGVKYTRDSRGSATFRYRDSWVTVFVNDTYSLRALRPKEKVGTRSTPGSVAMEASEAKHIYELVNRFGASHSRVIIK